MKAVLGLLLICLGIILGVYVGAWVCFVGGIVGIIKVVIDLYHGLAFNGSALGISILKFILSGIAGYTAAIVLVIPGVALLEHS